MADLNFEEISFQIIAYAGEAKSNAILAIKAAKTGNFDQATSLINDADQGIINAEKAHMDVITQEANGVKLEIPVIFMHAEDQLLTTQTLVLIAQEFVDLYRLIQK